MNVKEIFEKYSGRLFNTALRIVGDRFEAEEIAHDVILKFWKFEKNLKREQIEAWLVKSCCRASIDVLRKKNRGFVFEEGIPEIIQEEDFPDTERQDELVERIKTELMGLPEGYRTILSLYLFEGYDYGEISDILGIKEVSVRSQYMRGKEKLRSKIIKYHG